MNTTKLLWFIVGSKTRRTVRAVQAESAGREMNSRKLPEERPRGDDPEPDPQTWR